jgi:quinol monooxygenase YgiN
VTIGRVFRARPKPGKAKLLEQQMHEHAIPGVAAAAAGLVAHHAGTPHGATGEFLMVTIWEDLDAVRAFAGDDYERPVLYADTAELIDEMWLHHYEGAG